MQRFNVSSGPVVADYVTADREEELLRVLDPIGARDVVVGPERDSRWNTEHVRGWLLAGGGLKDRQQNGSSSTGAQRRSAEPSRRVRRND